MLPTRSIAGTIRAAAASAALLSLAACETTGGLGSNLTPANQQELAEATSSALEQGRTGEGLNWSGTNGDIVGTVTPIRTYYRSGGEPCRDFQRSLTVNGKTEVQFGTACRERDGTWTITDSRSAYRNGYYPQDDYHDPYWSYPYGYYGYGPRRYGSGFRFGYGHGFRW